MGTRSGSERTFTEEFQVAGGKLVDRVRELLAEGHVRRIKIKGSSGEPILEIPMNVGAIAGGAVALAAPWLAVLGAFAALVAHATIEVVRVEEPDDKAGSAKPGKKADADRGVTIDL